MIIYDYKGIDLLSSLTYTTWPAAQPDDHAH